MRKLSGWIVVGLLSVGCASRLYVNSEPAGARVDLVSPQNYSATELGQTPLKLTQDQLTEKQMRGPYLLRISKVGLQPKEILVTSLGGLDVDVQVQLQSGASTQRLNDLVNDLFAAQTLAQKGDQPGAIEKLNQLSRENPDIAAVYEMRGSLYMVRGDFAAASKDFSTAVNIDPQNRELRVLYESAQRKAARK